MIKKADFKRSLAAWAEQERRASDDHPTAAALDDYRRGVLPPAAKEELKEHLVLCHPCFDQVRDLDAFHRVRSADGGPASRSPAVADFETAAFWRTLRPRLEARPATPAVRRPGGRRSGAWRLPAAVAASVLVTALGFSFWVGSQHRALAASEARLAALQAPRPNARIYDLYVDTSERSGENRPQPVEVAAGSMLILTPRDAGDYPEVAVEIYDAAGSQAWAGSGFAADPVDGSFTLWLPPELLPPGDYRVRLVGRGADTSELIEEYEVRMVR